MKNFKTPIKNGLFYGAVRLAERFGVC